MLSLALAGIVLLWLALARSGHTLLFLVGSGLLFLALVCPGRRGRALAFWLFKDVAIGYITNSLKGVLLSLLVGPAISLPEKCGYRYECRSG